MFIVFHFVFIDHTGHLPRSIHRELHSLFIAIYSISPTPLNIWVVSLTNNTSVSNLQKSCVHMQEYLSDKVPEVEYQRQKVNAFIVLIDITFCILSSNVPVSLLPLSCW